MATPDITPNGGELKPLRELNNVQMVNLIRNESAPTFQKRIPSATQANIREVLRTISNSQSLRNAFFETLINRIGQTYINTWTWDNPLDIFERSSMTYGDTYQEIAVGMPTARVYDPKAEYLGGDNFRNYSVEVDSLYHKLDFQHMYPITTDVRTWNQAFLGEGNIGTLTSQLITSCYNAASVDVFATMCELFTEYARMGGYWRVHMDNDLNDMGSTQDNARDLLRQIRAWADNLKFVSTKYNARHMPVFARPDELVLFCTPEVKSALDVQGLATVFQRTDAEPTIDRIIVIPREYFGIDGVQAILTTQDFFVDVPVVNEMTTMQNPANINSINHFLHLWKIISVSAFQPAILFWTGTGSSETVVLPEGTTATAPTMRLKLAVDGSGETPKNVRRGGVVQVIADTTITNDDTATWRSGAVSYEIGDADKPLSPYTRISQTGVLVVGLDETNTRIPVTAKALYIDPSHPEVESAMSAALAIPVVGDGIIGFTPSLVASVEVNVVAPAINAKHQANATATMTDGRKADVTQIAAWSSSAANIASVDGGGIVTGVSAGKADIVADVFGVTGKQSITVAANAGA